MIKHLMDEEAMEEERKDAKRLQMLWGIDDNAHVQIPHNALIFSKELGLQPADHVLIAMMMSYARQKGQWVWPSVETLARQMNCTVDALRKRLRRLAKEGMVLHRVKGVREEWSLKPFHSEVAKVARQHPDRAHPGFTSLPTKLVRNWTQGAFPASQDAYDVEDVETRPRDTRVRSARWDDAPEGPLSTSECYALMVLLSHEHEQDYAGTRQGVYVSRQQLAREMGVVGLPVSVLIDREGREIARLMGEEDWASEPAKQLIRELTGL